MKGKTNVWSLWTFCISCTSIGRRSIQHQDSSDTPAQSCSWVQCCLRKGQSHSAQQPSRQGNWDRKQSFQGTQHAAILMDFPKLCFWFKSSSGITGLCFADKNEIRVCVTPWKHVQRFAVPPTEPRQLIKMSLLLLACVSHSTQS